MVSTANDWQEVTIGQLGKVVTGRTPPSRNPESFGTEYPFITPTDIDEQSRVVHTERFLSEEGYDKQKRSLLPTGTVCFTCIGATIGKICMTAQPSFTNQQINSIVVDNDNHDSHYVYYLLRQQVDQIKAFAGGAATPIINKSAFSNVKVSVPPFSTQRKIASILSAYDDLIENNTRRIEILEEMAQAIYREWFVNFRFPGHEKVGMVDSPLGKIPGGWTVKSLGEIAEQVRRNVKPEQFDPETPYVGLEHIPRKSIALSEWGTVADVQSSKLAFNRDEILFGKIRPYFHKVALAPVDGLCSSDTIVISPIAREHFGSVLFTVSSDEFVDHATQTSQGTKMPRADWSVLVKYPVVVPPPVLLGLFNELVENIVSQIQNLAFRNRNLRRTRDLLLPKLISGRIEVEGLDLPDTDLIS